MKTLLNKYLTLHAAVLRAPDDDQGGNDGGSDNQDNGGNDGGNEGGNDAGKSARAKAGIFDTGDDAGKNENQDQGREKAGVKDGARPDYIPEKFWDADKGAVRVEAMAKAYADTETAIGKLKREKGFGEVPEKATDYFPEGIDLSDDAANVGTIAADDPGLTAFANVAKKHGIGTELAQTLAKDFLRSINDELTPPVDMDQERAKLGENATAQINGVWNWITALEDQGKLSPNDVDRLISLSGDAAGITLLTKLRGLSGAEPIPYTPGADASAMSREDWAAQYRAAVKAKDYALQEKLEKMNVWGDEAGRSGPQGFVDAEAKRG